MVAEFLLRHYRRTGSPAALAMAEGTCEAMARGGMYDQLGGGFARYSTDAAWVVPHFEKMLYDNALLARVYLNLWRATGSELGRRVAEETCAWLVRRAEHARAAGSPPRWTPTARVKRGSTTSGGPPSWTRSSDRRTASSPRRSSASPQAGTFERGASVLQRRAEPADADAGRLDRVRQALLAARRRRVPPGRDDKVVAAWNGLAISALAECGLLLGRPGFIDAARAAATVLAEVHYGRGRLVRTSRHGSPGTPRACWRTTPASPTASSPCPG